MSTQAAAPAASSDSGRADPAGRYIVVLKKSATLKAVRDRHARLDGTRADRTFSKVLKGFAGKLTADQVQSLRADPDVAAIVPDELVEVAGQIVPTGVLRIGGRRSSVAQIDGVDQRVDADVAVVDTGIDPKHPDLNVVGGINCSTSDPNAWQDDNHHGTHVAGTIGALDNGFGVVGVAPGVRLWAVRILNADGYGLLSWYVCGLDWIARQRDPVDPSRPLIEAVNMSVAKWGADDHNCGYTNNDILHQAICRVTAAGITIVVAAGNDSGNAARRVPAAYGEVITVSALADTDGKPGGLGGNRCWSWGGYDVDDTFADFSNYGSVVDLIAPGKCIWSTLPGNSYGYSSGTSMATPAVTGAVALYRASRPWTTPAQVKAALQYLGNLNWKTSTDPDSTHEKLLDVSRVGPAGDFSVALGSANLVGEAGGTQTVPVTLTRTATHFENVALKVTGPARVVGSLARTSLMGFTNDATTLTIVVPPSTPAGTYTLTVTGTEGPHVHSATTSVVVENDPPTAFAPGLSIALGWSTRVTGTRLLVAWRKATDASSAIAGYQLQSALDGGAWSSGLSLGGAMTAATFNGTYGHRYQFRLRARDAAGNWSGWQTGASLLVSGAEDTTRSMRYSAGWVRLADGLASGGSLHETVRVGASASLAVTGRQVGIVGRTGPTSGAADVFIDGLFRGRISFWSRTVINRLVLFSTTLRSGGPHTIVIRNVRAAGRTRIDLDAILIGR